MGDLLLPGMVAAAMAFAGTRVFDVLPPTQNLTTSTVIGSKELRYLGTRKITHMYARTIVCPPVNLFMCSYTYNRIIDFSITTVEQLTARVSGVVQSCSRHRGGGPADVPHRPTA